MPIVQHSHAQRFRQRDRQPRFGGVIAQQPGRVCGPGDGHSVDRFRCGDRMPADDRAADLLGDRDPAGEHLAHELHRQHLARPADEVDRHDRHPAHRVDVRERIRRSDPPPVVGGVDDRGEEISCREHRQIPADLHGCGIIAVIEADEHIRAGLSGERCECVFELAGRDLARTAAAGGQRCQSR